MRLWLDPNGVVVNDGRLLSHISSYGSLSEAAKEEDFKLLSDTGSDRRESDPGAGSPAWSRNRPRRHLVAYCRATASSTRRISSSREWTLSFT